MHRHRTLARWFFPHVVFQDVRDFFADGDSMAIGTMASILMHEEQVTGPLLKNGWGLVEATLYEDGYAHIVAVRKPEAKLIVELPSEPDPTACDDILVCASFRDRAELLAFEQHHEPLGVERWLTWYGDGACPLEPNRGRYIVSYAPEAYNEWDAHNRAVSVVARSTYSHAALLHSSTRLTSSALEKCRHTLLTASNHSVLSLRGGTDTEPRLLFGRSDALAAVPYWDGWPTPEGYCAAEHHLAMGRAGVIPVATFVNYTESDATVQVHEWSQTRQAMAFKEVVHRGRGKYDEPDARPSPEHRSPSSTTRTIFVLCPTREREKRLMRMLNTMQATATHPERVHLWLGYDESDRKSKRLEKPEWFEGQLRLFEAETEGLGPCVHAMAEAIDPPDDAVMLYIGDDCVFETTGWDEIVDSSLEREAEEGPLVFYPNDGLQCGAMTIWWWASGKTARAMDWIMSSEWNVHNDTFVWTIAHLFSPPRVAFYRNLMLAHAWEAEHEKQLDTRPKDVARINSRLGEDRATLFWEALKGKENATTGEYKCRARDPYMGQGALEMSVTLDDATGRVKPAIYDEVPS